MTKKTTTSINFEMSSKTNKALTQSATAAKRTKRHEAATRLEDHLKRFEYQDNQYVEKDAKG